MTERADLVIVGAGPAGMAAAIQARALGLTVSVLDQQHEPGGQIYRSLERVRRTRPQHAGLLGEHYQYGARLLEQFRDADIDYRPGTSVWRLQAGKGVCYTDGTRSTVLDAGHILIACGALERPMPIAGWTLPGVMGAGAAQILFKNAGLLPDGPVVLAGAGPLLLLVAIQLVQAGAEVAAIVEHTRRSDYLRAAPWLLPALRNFSDLRNGLTWRRHLRNAGVAIHSGVGEMKIFGEHRARHIRFTKNGRTAQLDVGVVLLHDGVTPHTQLSRQAGCDHEWLELQRHWRPVRDAWGATSVPGVHVAGDCGGISGARVAQAHGAIAALDIAFRAQASNRAERDERAQVLRDEANRYGATRPLLDHLFAPQHQRAVQADDETILCRCEEVRAGEIRRAARLGASGLNQLKAYTRCGMGACQGRMCSLSVAEIIAAERGIHPAHVDPLRVRPPIVPISLGEIAGSNLIQS